MQLNDMFAIAEDDDVGPFACSWCGAMVEDRAGAELHLEFHTELSRKLDLLTERSKWGF